MVPADDSGALWELKVRSAAVARRHWLPVFIHDGDTVKQSGEGAGLQVLMVLMVLTDGPAGVRLHWMTLTQQQQQQHQHNPTQRSCRNSASLQTEPLMQ